MVYARGRNAYRGSMSHRSSRSGSESSPSLHLATIAHGGVIWDAYLDFEDDPRDPYTCRARLRFEPPTGAEGLEATETTVLIIEDSYEEAAARARAFDDRQLQGLLRSTLPESESDA